MSRLAIIIFLILLTGFALATETMGQLLGVVKGEIIEINEEHGFIIINQGKNGGVDIGSILDIYRGTGKMGKAEAVKVRDSIAAAEIIRIKPGAIIKVGDTVILSRGIPESILKRRPYSKGLAKVAANIDADTRMVWFYLIQTLRGYGFIIIDSNKASGLLTACKNLELSLGEEIWADIRGYTDYEAVLWATAISRGKGRTYLSFEFDGNYNRYGKYQRFPIGPKDKVYQEIKEIVKKVKEEAER